MSNRLNDYEFLGALKLGEEHTFTNNEQRNVPPSDRVKYRQLCAAMSEMNAKLGSRQFVVRANSDQRSMKVVRVSDGKTSVEAPRPIRKAYMARRTKLAAPAAEPVTDIAALVQREVAKSLKQFKLGRTWWIVDIGYGSEYRAFLTEEDAEGYAAILVHAPVISVREAA